LEHWRPEVNRLHVEVDQPGPRVQQSMDFRVFIKVATCGEIRLLLKWQLKLILAGLLLLRRWLRKFSRIIVRKRKAVAVLTINHTMMIQTKKRWIFDFMFNTNRRHTEALEKSARALKRLAAAEETIAKNLGEFLRDDEAESDPPPLPKEVQTQRTKQPHKK
jgi:hypothetical protein